MNDDLVKTLQGLKQNPALVARLYEQLFAGRFIALVADPAQDLSAMSFLTYPTADQKRELPVFTGYGRSLLPALQAAPGNPQSVEIEGGQLWSRMLDIVRAGECGVEVDPGEPHGIRLTREMILGMVSAYGDPPKD